MSLVHVPAVGQPLTMPLSCTFFVPPPEQSTHLYNALTKMHKDVSDDANALLISVDHSDYPGVSKNLLPE